MISLFMLSRMDLVLASIVVVLCIRFGKMLRRTSASRLLRTVVSGLVAATTTIRRRLVVLWLLILVLLRITSTGLIVMALKIL